MIIKVNDNGVIKQAVIPTKTSDLQNDSGFITSSLAQCNTEAGVAAKTAICPNYVLRSDSYLHFSIRNANTYAGPITMNVNNTGAKPIYINGIPSSASNYTLPAGTYLVWYGESHWSFRTDNHLPVNISGDAITINNGLTVEKSVPADAVFTDTTDLGSMTGTLGIDHGGTGATDAATARSNLGLTPLIKIDYSSRANVTIGSGGYEIITDTHPIPTESGYTFIFAFVKTWNSMSSPGSFNITGDASYVLGQPNVTINGLQIGYVFLKDL